MKFRLFNSVSCRSQGTGSRIRVQSNGLPPFCFSSLSPSPVTSNLDWEVDFNADVSRVAGPRATTNAELSRLLCDRQQFTTPPTYANYSSIQEPASWSTMVGVSLSGQLIGSALSSTNFTLNTSVYFADALFPPSSCSACASDILDSVFQSIGADGSLAARMMSKAMTGTAGVGAQLGLCSSTAGCSTDIRTYASYYTLNRFAGLNSNFLPGTDSRWNRSQLPRNTL